MPEVERPALRCRQRAKYQEVAALQRSDEQRCTRRSTWLYLLSLPLCPCANLDKYASTIRLRGLGDKRASRKMKYSRACVLVWMFAAVASMGIVGIGTSVEKQVSKDQARSKATLID